MCMVKHCLKSLMCRLWYYIQYISAVNAFMFVSNQFYGCFAADLHYFSLINEIFKRKIVFL